jgi:hypothetical protein
LHRKSQWHAIATTCGSHPIGTLIPIEQEILLLNTSKRLSWARAAKAERARSFFIFQQALKYAASVKVHFDVG